MSEVRRLTRRLFVLITLVMGLAFLTYAPSSRAVTCCTTCDTRLDHCLSNCGNIPSCRDKCFVAYDNCYLTCDIGC
jgi:hypothetical protein